MDLDEFKQKALMRTWPLHQALYRHLESAIEKVRADFLTVFDPWYFTHGVRHHICQLIDAVPVKDATRIPHPMSGLEFKYFDYTLKVWKVNEGEMPIAGQSPRRQEFLKQPYLPNYIDSLKVKDDLPLNLFLSWDVDRDLHLTDVRLVCPLNFDSPWKPGEEYFWVSVPHPVLEVSSSPEFSVASTELDDIELELKKRTADNKGNDNQN